MNNKIRWGVMGAGRLARDVVREVQSHGVQVHAIGARDQKRADEFAAELGLAKAHGSYEALANDPEIDAVYIVTTAQAHLECALIAIAAGKHVLIEKPFAMDAAEAAQIVAAARKAGVFCMEAMWTRFLPMQIELFKCIEAGMIGEPQYLTADHSQFLPPERADRLWSRELGGGSLLDLGVYPINFAARLFGLPTSLVARGTLTDADAGPFGDGAGDGGVDSQVSIIFDHVSGQRSTLQACMTQLGSTDATILGTLGSIVLDGPFYQQSSFRVLSPSGEVLHSFGSPVLDDGKIFEFLEAEARIQAGQLESPVMPLDESIAIMGVMDEVRAQIGVVWG
jgi:predicted dehydrogenase